MKSLICSYILSIFFSDHLIYLSWLFLCTCLVVPTYGLTLILLIAIIISSQWIIVHVFFCFLSHNFLLNAFIIYRMIETEVSSIYDRNASSLFRSLAWISLIRNWGFVFVVVMIRSVQHKFQIYPIVGKRYFLLAFLLYPALEILHTCYRVEPLSIFLPFSSGRWLWLVTSC